MAVLMQVSTTEVNLQTTMQHPRFSSMPSQKLGQIFNCSPDPVLSGDANPYRHRKPLPEELKYSSGRFLFNESARLAARNIRLDIDALEGEVSKRMNHARVVSTRLHAEGRTSRLLQMDLDDHRNVIVKIPYRPQPPHYATASEAATLSFLRKKGIPVPKVYGWSSNAARNKAGVEFIIMEKAQGIATSTHSGDLEKPDVEQIVSEVVDVERFLFELPFSAFGSLYFKSDVPQEYQRSLFSTRLDSNSRFEEHYCIGPSTDPFFWSAKTPELNRDHGPWQSTSDYLESIGRCALNRTSHEPLLTTNKFPFNALFEDDTRTSDQCDLIKQYLEIAPLLLTQSINRVQHKPAFRHPDLSSRNIFVSESTTTITCITNWRHATIVPFAAAAGFPRAFDSPSSPQGSLRSPRLPPNFNTTLDNDAQSDAKKVYLHQLLHYTYRIKTTLHNPIHAEIMDILTVQVLQRLLHALRSPWSGIKNLILLKGALIALAQTWRNFSTGVACPAVLTFDHEVVEGQAQDDDLLDDAEELITYVKKEIGIYYDRDERVNVDDDNQGWVSRENYEAAMRRNRELKEEWMAQAASVTEERQIDLGWMFQDDVHQQDHVPDGALGYGTAVGSA